jgi:DNA-binding Lrp family transcriptional regulator
MAKLENLRRGGASIRGMANELGLSPTTVARLVRNLPAHHPSRATEVA